MKNTIIPVCKIFALIVIGLLCIGVLPSWTCFLGLFAMVLLVPIPSWQTLLRKFLKTGIRRGIAIALVIIMIAAAPADISPTHSSPVNSVVTTTTVSTTNTKISATHTATTATVLATTTTTTKTSTTVTTTTTKATTTTTVATTTAMVFTTTTVPPHVHEFADATCNEPKTCVGCGETEGYALGHEYSDGNCSRCGAEDPNYVREVMVWIPSNGGEKYHSKSTCSKMIDPEYVSLSEAESLGFEPCGRCY